MNQRQQLFINAVERGDQAYLAREVEQLSPAFVARTLESLEPDERFALWELIPAQKRGAVLVALGRGVRAAVIASTDPEQLIAILAQLPMDKLADIDAELPLSVNSAIEQILDHQQRQRYQLLNQYPDHSAGGLMDIDAIVVRADTPLKAVLRYLRQLKRRSGIVPEHLDSLMVVDRHHRYLGRLPLSELVSGAPDSTVDTLMVAVDDGLDVATPASEVSRLFEEHDLLSAAVVNGDGQLLGRITVDDVIDEMRDEADRERYGRVGLEQGPDLFAPVARSASHRALWLGINLATAFLAAWVIGLFEASIEKLVALAVLMPVVASMSGVAGNQTLTLVVRALALGQLRRGNFPALLWRECAIALLNGVVWALVVAVIALLWFGDGLLASAFAVSMVIALLIAALTGAMIPVMLQRLSIDPALAGGVVLTTVTDATGFLTFLGLATLWLL